jgi:hypothetical protein
MFDIIMKRGTIHVDFFTDEEQLYNTAYIDRANKFYPDWWKKLPKQLDTFETPCATMKTCRGFIDLYANSLIFPSPTDMWFNVTEKDYKVHTPSGERIDDYHNQIQRGDFLKNFHHAKLLPRWVAKCKNDIKFSWQKPMYNFENPLDFILLDGVVDFKYQRKMNINICFRKTLKTIKIDFLQPLVMITPQTEKKITFKRHLVSKQEYDRTSKLTKPVKFINNYLTLRKYREQEEKKCPFHF